MKNVFIIGSKGMGNYGGYETFVENLTLYRTNMDIQYHVACLSESNNEEFEHNGARCFNVRIPKIGAARAVVYDLIAIRRCINYIKNNKIKDAVIYILACRIGPFIRSL